MPTQMLTRQVVQMVALGICLLAGTLSAAEAAITVRSAGVVSGVAVVEGRAAPDATLSWEGAAVTQANRGGNFVFQGIVPSDCVGTLSDGIVTIEVALANCVPASEPAGQVRKTGQTSCWDATGALIACAGTGQDGELRKGLARSYTDNGDGTITDNTTGLVWEKLTDDGSIHDVNRTSNWDGAFSRIATLNAANFAGHGDWRLPNVNELQSLVDYGNHPAVEPVSVVSAGGELFEGRLNKLL
jgi:hypothetical protein